MHYPTLGRSTMTLVALADEERPSALCAPSQPPSDFDRDLSEALVDDTLRLPDAGIDLRDAVESFENQLIRQALERTKWNKKQAASLLGLNRTTLVEMLKRKRIGPHAA